MQYAQYMLEYKYTHVAAADSAASVTSKNRTATETTLLALLGLINAQMKRDKQCFTNVCHCVCICPYSGLLEHKLYCMYMFHVFDIIEH